MNAVATARKTEQAAELRKRIAALQARKQETESALARERATQESVTAKRTEMVGELTGADDATAGWAHDELDGLDSSLRVSSRVSEGLSVSLTRIANEIEPLTAELQDVQRAIEAEKRAATLRVFQSKMEHAAKVASDQLANARERLADLNRLAAQGVEAYGDAGLRVCGPIVEAFVLGEANLDARGWKPSSPSYTRLEFWVRSLTRG